ncbi:alpha/beta-Hydrolase [Apiospora marii]|uniref:alpha/beta-Hydrolase n=1 Tax=Apiospora marii TaxID=335849 RepID=UPI0031316EFF
MAVSSSSPAKPAFVLVSGAWHGTGYWAKVVAGLLREGYRATPVALRSASAKPAVTFMDDVNAVRDVIRGEVARGCDVVVVAHSLGTVVGASAIKGFARFHGGGGGGGKTGQDVAVTEVFMNGDRDGFGHVIGFVALATGFLPTGVCFLQALGGKAPPLWRFGSEPLATTEEDVDDDGESTTKTFATIRISAREAFYHDLPVEEGERWVERLSPQGAATIAQGGEFVYAGWLDVPCWSLVTTEDRAFPPEAQRAMAQAARDAGADVWSEEIVTSHSPMLSRPAETVDFLRRAAVAFGEKALLRGM